ncbi:transmembrane 9 superfamily member 1-like [Tasmannia lanceolata]|uniref:transmembrane 9 superfamily member 1-like n=1 Tax=Tasmannia lanceolata TaxID=3420 RepID=UPI004062DEB5
MFSTVRSFSLFAPLLFLLLVGPSSASESDHKYQVDDPVTLWVNKVGPYNNPQETYNYYSLPFCQSSGNPAHKWGGLGEVLGGNELIDSRIDIKFQKNVDRSSICKLDMDAAKVNQFKNAIENAYWFEFFMDDLPAWGFVGELHPDKSNENKHLLYNHKIFTVRFNGDQIISVNLTQENPKPLEVGKTIDLTYSIKWVPTNITFGRRFDVYLDYPFFEHQIHWFSIFNSFMMVIFLTGLVSMILMRTLRNDYAKYAREDDDLETLERDVNEESGWKLVHGDVFRPPHNLVLLSAVVGTGAQLAMLVLLVIILAIIGMLYIGCPPVFQVTVVAWGSVRGYVPERLNEPVFGMKRTGQLSMSRPVRDGRKYEVKRFGWPGLLHGPGRLETWSVISVRRPSHLSGLERPETWSVISVRPSILHGLGRVDLWSAIICSAKHSARPGMDRSLECDNLFGQAFCTAWDG